MKVLKEGSWKDPWSSEIECGTFGCGALLLIEESDVKPKDYDTSGRFYFVCPSCNKQTFIPAESIPIRLREALDRVRKYSSGGYDDR